MINNRNEAGKMTDRSEEYRTIVDGYSARKKLKRPSFISGDLVYIPLQNGNVAFTEAENYELVIGCSWSEMAEGYVQGHYKYSPRRKLHKWLWYHVNGEIPKDMCMDHINRNRLDNRLANLRVVTYSDNARNAKKSGGTSKYPGVSFCSREKKWRAFIQKELKQYSLGMHKTEEKAFAAYYAKAVELGVEHSIPMEFKRVTLPTDGNKITPKMLDSKADLEALIDGAEIFRLKKEMGA